MKVSRDRRREFQLVARERHGRVLCVFEHERFPLKRTIDEDRARDRRDRARRAEPTSPDRAESCETVICDLHAHKSTPSSVACPSSGAEGGGQRT